MRRCGSEKYLRLSKRGDKKKHADTTRVSACFFTEIRSYYFAESAGAGFAAGSADGRDEGSRF